MATAIDLALGIWAEGDTSRHLWSAPAFTLPFAVIALCFTGGIYVLVALFKALPLPTLLHERDLARQWDARRRYASLIFEGVCLANDPLLSPERLQEFIDKASNFTTWAFGHEQLLLMSKEVLREPGATDVQTRHALLQSQLHRMTNILDRQAAVKPGFSATEFEEIWKRLAADDLRAEAPSA